jgi:SAM-dependent methyltransferase
MTHQQSLLSQQGRELLGRLAGEHISAQQALRLAQALRGSYPPDLVAAALTQQVLRTAARAKFSRADEMLFTRPGLEQASAELTARHSAARFAGARLVADLCCGIGGNLTALAAGRHVLAVDRDLTSLEYARHNAAVYGAAGGIAVVCADVREIPLTGPRRGGPGGADGVAAAAEAVDGVFVDPARRAGGRRLTGGRSDPPLDWCLGLAGYVPSVGIKAAPGIAHELVPAGWEIEFLAVRRSLKEALLWSPALATASRRATVLPGGDTLTASPGPPVPLAAPGGFLLDPNPAVTRAGLVQPLARQLGGWQIDPMIAFLSADRPLRTPFGRALRVLESAPWHEKEFGRRLRALGIGAVDIRRRGLAGDVEQIRRRLGLRGAGSATIVITRMNGRPWGLICTEVDTGPFDPPSATQAR